MTLQPTDWSFLIFNVKLDVKHALWLFVLKNKVYTWVKLLFLLVAVKDSQLKSFKYILERSDY